MWLRRFFGAGAYEQGRVFGRYLIRKASGCAARHNAKTASEHLAPFPFVHIISPKRNGARLPKHRAPPSEYALPRPCTCVVSIQLPSAKINYISWSILRKLQDIRHGPRYCGQRGRRLAGAPRRPPARHWHKAWSLRCGPGRGRLRFQLHEFFEGLRRRVCPLDRRGTLLALGRSCAVRCMC